MHPFPALIAFASLANVEQQWHCVVDDKVKAGIAGGIGGDSPKVNCLQAQTERVNRMRVTMRWGDVEQGSLHGWRGVAFGLLIVEDALFPVE